MKRRRHKRERRPWTDAELLELRRRFPTDTARAIARSIGHSVSSIYQRAHQLGVRKDPAALLARNRALGRRMARHPRAIANQFKPGTVPPNKGLRRPGWAPGRMAETQFKAGIKPHTWVPVGTEVVDTEGYRKIKVRDDAPKGMSRKNWAFVHIRVWEEANGPVPAGHAVAFKDGDKSNTALANLELVTRQELMRRNTIHTRFPKEVCRAIQLRGALKRQINRRTRELAESTTPGPTQ